MTVTDANNTASAAAAPAAAEPEISLPPGKASFGATEAEHIPVAFASVLEEPYQQQQSSQPPLQQSIPGYAVNENDYQATAVQQSQPENLALSDPAFVQAQQEAYAHAQQQAYAQAQSQQQHQPASVVVQGQPVPNTPHTTSTGQSIPPNAPPGGQWVRVKYTGNQTWTIITATGCCLFWCAAMILAPCALLGMWCPCDEKTAYMSPSGVIYDETGKALGDARRNKYTVLGKA